MTTTNLPAKSKAADIRTLLEKSRKQMEMALPKHLTADRLLRVAMTSIQKNPKLMECTPQSLLACVMTCAQLGLEPDQFLGQAYLVPFKDTKKNATICTLIPGYRGYIALARRSGEMQTVSAQVVYSKDDFKLQYGINDTLEHTPAMNGDRGEPIGAYCIFKYKDGGYSFDFLPASEIEKVRKRSKAASDGPWVTDWDEMAKKTVIKRHAKLAPLSVEFQRAVALEDRANLGESQADLLGMDDDDVIDADAQRIEDNAAGLKAFDDSIPKGTDAALLDRFLSATADRNKTTVETLKVEAGKKPADFWKFFNAWAKQEQAKAAKGGKEAVKQAEPADVTDPEPMSAPCPNTGENYKEKYCTGCPDRKGCPAW